jgi:hypothetical protein
VISRAAEALAASLQSAAGRRIVYQRGSEACELTAYVGQTIFETVSGLDDISEAFYSRDYLFPVCDLILGGEPADPQAGDRIIDGPSTFEVMRGQGERPYRYSDSGRTLLRVHTKEVG